MSDFDVDLFVIGGGIRAARVAAGRGARVMLAEEYQVGGTCVTRGCVTKKLFVYAGRYREEFKDAAEFGWTIGRAHFKWSTLVAAMQREVGRLEGLYLKSQNDAGVEIVKCGAVFEDARTLRFAGSARKVRAKTILIATGASRTRRPSPATAMTSRLGNRSSVKISFEVIPRAKPSSDGHSSAWSDIRSSLFL